MFSKKMQNALNEQINAELYSAYMYLAMSAYFESVNLRGFASWMRVQAQEETGHAMKIFGFVCERGGKVTLKAIDTPPDEWKSPLDVMQATYKHEQKVTGLINKLMDLAIKDNDHATKGFLQWFVDEQVEEEASADEIVQQLKMIKDSTGALFMIDHHLGERKADSD
ncbi:MAG: ferritin [Phycisphaerae bacterium]